MTETEQQIIERMKKAHAARMAARREDKQTLHINSKGKGYYTAVPCIEESEWEGED